MEKNELCVIQTLDLDKDITFEFSKDVRMTTKVSFKKGDIIEQLLNRIDNLEKEVSKLDKQKIICAGDSLTELWENEDDAKWDDCLQTA